MQPVIIALGVVTLLSAGIHVFAGGPAVARPMLRAKFDDVARHTMYVCWHAVSAQLLLFGVVLLVVGARAPTSAGDALVGVISALHLGYAALFIAIALRSGRPRGLVELGQWMVFLPLGAVGLLSAI